MVDLLYVAHNRLAFTEATFPALVAHTNWDLVHSAWILDDASIDGTADYLANAVFDIPCKPYFAPFKPGALGGPVAAMNYALDHMDTDVLVKVDNDLLVCPGWLDSLLDVLTAHPGLDVLGFEAGFGDAVAPADTPRTARPARHVGGLGAFRKRLFAQRRPVQHETFFGMTQFMVRNAHCGWLSPALPCVLLDHLPFEPWRSLTREYVERGWSRQWSEYPERMRDYWAWAFDEAVA